MARSLFRDHSVIVREVERNRNADGVYRCLSAQNKADKRACRVQKKILDVDDVLRNWVIQKMKIEWSPQKISGRLKNHSDSYIAGSYVCHETIYSYIYEGDGTKYGKNSLQEWCIEGLTRVSHGTPSRPKHP